MPCQPGRNEVPSRENALHTLRQANYASEATVARRRSSDGRKENDKFFGHSEFPSTSTLLADRPTAMRGLER